MDSYSNYIQSRLSGNMDAYGNLKLTGNDNGEPKQIQKQVIAEMQKEVDSLEPEKKTLESEKKIRAQRKVFKNYRSALRRKFLMEEQI